METQITKRIFQDLWAAFQLKHTKIFDYVKEEVEKTLSCRNPDKLGFHRYVCPEHPEQMRIVPHSCKSRFCNGCCKLLADKWIERTSSSLPDCWYWHITLTCPKQLRSYFLLLPELKDIFFKVGSETILSWFRKRKSLPALISAFHSHGRDLKFHPHLHCVLSCGGVDLESKAVWKECHFLPFKMLRERWKVKFLLALEGVADEGLREELFQLNWYVNVSSQRMNSVGTLHYIGRYAQRPIVSEKRIAGYDGRFVTFWYDDFRSNSKVRWTLPAEQFISLLIQHIHQPGFRAIRCYGLLACRKKWFWLAVLRKLRMLRKAKLKRFLSWRERQFRWSKRDPLACPVCGKEMMLVEMAFPNKLGGLIFIY